MGELVIVICFGAGVSITGIVMYKGLKNDIKEKEAMEAND